MDELSLNHTTPLERWIKDGAILKFWGDNVDKQKKVRDPRADNTGNMVHMFSLLAGRSRTPAPHLPHVGGNLSVLDSVPAEFFLPDTSDVSAVKGNLVHIVCRVLTRYISGLAPLATHPSRVLQRNEQEV